MPAPKGRFDFLDETPKPGEAMPMQAPDPVTREEVHTAPTEPVTALDLPAPSSPHFVAAKRTTLGVRARQDLHANLSDLTAALRERGWNLGQSDLLEHWLKRLADPEYARAFLQDLEAHGR